MTSRHSLKSFTRSAVVALALLFLLPLALAGEDYAAQTAKNINISTEDLTAMLLPLTQEQLKVEAAAWQDNLSRKAAQISKLEIRNRDQKQEAGEQPSDGAGGGNAADTKGVANSEQSGAAAEKAITALEEKIALLLVDQGSVGKRLGIVLDALESKGGDVKEQRLYLHAVTAIKPTVDNTSATLLAAKAWMKSEDGGQLFLINILKFVAAIVFVVFLARILGGLTDRLIARQPVSMLLESFIKVAVRRVVLTIGFIACLPIIGVNIGPVLALIGAAGLVIGLALQGTLSNFASGVLILIYRPYDMGDAVTVSGVSGTVSGMNLLSTTIKTFDNQLITIPNNNVWNGAITNITGSDTRRVDMVFGIGYSDDFGKAQEILQAILSQHPKVLETPEPTIRLHELADSSVNLICRPWTKTEDYWGVHWDVMESVKREFDKQGISIPFPQSDVHFYPAVETSASEDKNA